MLLSPPGRWRSLPAHMESGQARVHSGVRPLASLARPLRLQSRQLGSSPLSTFVAQGTSALTATRRRDCGRRSRPQTRSSHAPMACPRRPSVPDRRPARALLRESGHGRQTPNPPLQSLAVLRSRFRVCQPCWFIPSQPPQGGAMNARAASALRRKVGAGNPHHNITHHCITPRINGGAPKERRQVGKGIYRSKVLPAAGYTTRRYVKLLRQNFVAPFSVCPARS